MIRVVIDTNVILSGLLGFNRAHNKPAAVLRGALDGRFRAVTSDWIRSEVRDGLEQPFFEQRLGPTRRMSIVLLLENNSDDVGDLVHLVGVAPDPGDDPILATAVSGAAHLVVTGDRRLLSVGRYGDVDIVGVDALLAIVGGA